MTGCERSRQLSTTLRRPLTWCARQDRAEALSLRGYLEHERRGTRSSRQPRRAGSLDPAGGCKSLSHSHRVTLSAAKGLAPLVVGYRLGVRFFVPLRMAGGEGRAGHERRGMRYSRRPRRAGSLDPAGGSPTASAEDRAEALSLRGCLGYERRGCALLAAIPPATSWRWPAVDRCGRRAF